MNSLSMLFEISDKNQSIAFSVIVFVFIGLIILSIVIQNKFRKTTTHYSTKTSTSNKTGAEVARLILKENNITDVEIVKSRETKRGYIDNFNPTNKVITLSASVYDSTSLTAIAIASHEVGHAIQYNKGTGLIKLRTKMVMPVMIVSRIGSAIFQLGFSVFFFSMIFGTTMDFNTLFWFLIPGLIISGATLLFNLVTLPVEYDASKRAKQNLLNLNIISDKNDEEYEGVNKILSLAAKTYFVALLSTLTTFLMYILMILGSRR